MIKLVLVGGPHAGKTTVLNAARDEFAGQICVVHESPTMILRGDFPMPGKDLTWSMEWQRDFQRAVLAIQINMEKAFALVAQERGIKLLLCDCGTLTGAAYVRQTPLEFCQDYGLDLQEELMRYTSVIHLESLAVRNPARYSLIGNEHRFHNQEQAVEIEMELRRVWQPHQSRVLISDEIDQAIVKVFGIIRETLSRLKEA